MSEGGGVDESEVRWLISYADFMMQLLCLFILLFSVSSFQPAKLQAIEQSYREYKRLPRGTSAKAPAEGDQTKPIPKSDTLPPGNYLVVGNTTPYKEGSADIDRAELPALDKLIKEFEGTTNIIEIRGHTSGFEEDSINKDHFYLSYLRAMKVKEYMSRPKKPGDPVPMIDPRRIRIVPMGDSQPFMDYSKPEAREKNRRVEVLVTHETIH